MCIGYRMYAGVPGGVAGLAKGCCHVKFGCMYMSGGVWRCTCYSVGACAFCLCVKAMVSGWPR